MPWGSHEPRELRPSASSSASSSFGSASTQEFQRARRGQSEPTCCFDVAGRRKARDRGRSRDAKAVSIPWLRRWARSTSSILRAPSVQRAVAATALWKVMWSTRTDSTCCASGRGAVTSTKSSSKRRLRRAGCRRANKLKVAGSVMSRRR